MFIKAKEIVINPGIKTIPLVKCRFTIIAGISNYDNTRRYG